MDIKKLKEEIHKESYRSDPRSLIDVIDVDTLIDIIDELQAKNNEVLDLVICCQATCKYEQISNNVMFCKKHGRATRIGCP